MKESKFTWVKVYEQIIKKVLEYKNNREELRIVLFASQIAIGKEREEKDGKIIEYIDPFTLFSIINKYTSKSRRTDFIKNLEDRLELKIELPNDYDGIPNTIGLSACIYKDKGDSDALWNLAQSAYDYSNNNSLDNRNHFISDYNYVMLSRKDDRRINNLLFCMFPNTFVNLDINNRNLIKEELNVDISNYKDGEGYLKIIEDIKTSMKKNKTLYNNLLDLSNASWEGTKPRIIKVEEKNGITFANTGLTKEDWINIFNKNIITENGKNVLIKWYSMNNHEASCFDMEEKYNISDKIFNMSVTRIADNVMKEYKFILDGDDYSKKWPVVMIGHSDKHYVWKLKKEIVDAIKELNLEKKDNNGFGYYWLQCNPKVWSFANIKVGDTIEYNSYNDNGNKRRIYSNFENAKKNDKAIVYESTPTLAIIGLAEVEHELKDGVIVFKKIEHLVNQIPYKEVINLEELNNAEMKNNNQGTLFKLTKDQYAAIMNIVRDNNPTKEEQYSRYTKDDMISNKKLNERVFISEEEYKDLVYLIKNKKNVIIQGAPGVGKTFMAKKLAYSIMGEKNDNRIKFIQFHQSYSYEDFVEGIKPQEDGSFKIEKGLFREFIETIKADSDQTKPYFLIIDEINRGNLSKIFGELLMLIEEDKREKEYVSLAYSKIQFTVPQNLYIIGMMNTADRSLALIDYALRRRFSFYDVRPAFNNKSFIEYIKSLKDDKINNTIELIKELNVDIKNKLGSGFEIGHSYFCNLEDKDIDKVIKYDILPLLKEYWFDDDTSYTEWYKKLTGKNYED